MIVAEFKAHHREHNPYIDKINEFPDIIIPIHLGIEYLGRWQEAFNNQNPIFCELGSGYGHFLLEMATRYPNRNFIGIELKFKRLYQSAQKIRQNNITNVKYLRFDILQMEHVFATRELSGIYINYPDPWPKKQQLNKRMVSPILVSKLENILKRESTVQLKSDWEPYRKSFKEAFSDSKFVQTDFIEDISLWSRSEANIVTSYEKKFIKQGLSCFFYEYKLI